MTLEPGTTVEDTRRLESGMTRSEILALFKKRQDAWEDLDAKTLAAAVWIQNVLSGSWKLDWQAPPSQP